MSQLSQKKFDDQYASKKKKLNPRPDDDEVMPKSQKKLMSGTKSISKSKLSTQKKCEVTFSEGVEEIKDSEQNFKENNNSLTSTPLKSKSPSKTSLKSVKEHIKTPFSKIKDNSQSNTPIDARSKTNSVMKPTNQPNFNTEIMNESQSNKSNLGTPKNSVKKVDMTGSKYRSISKSPLIRIKEENNEVGQADNHLVEHVEKAEETEIVQAHNEEIEKVGEECETLAHEVKEEEASPAENLKEEIKLDDEKPFESDAQIEDQNPVSHSNSEEVEVKEEENLQENVVGVELILESVDVPQENETVPADNTEDN